MRGRSRQKTVMTGVGLDSNLRAQKVLEGVSLDVAVTFRKLNNPQSQALDWRSCIPVVQPRENDQEDPEWDRRSG